MSDDRRLLTISRFSIIKLHSPLKSVVGGVFGPEHREGRGTDEFAPVAHDILVVKQVDPPGVGCSDLLDELPHLALQTLHFTVDVHRPQQRQSEVLPEEMCDLALDRICSSEEIAAESILGLEAAEEGLGKMEP